MTDHQLPDFQAMSTDEVVAWFATEDAPVPLSTFPLHCELGRQGFLREFYWIGEESLFAAVAHVWDSLAEPKAARCTDMALAIGIDGTGKAALLGVLKHFFKAGMAIDHPLPERHSFATLDQWHESAMLAFANDEAALSSLLEKYAAVLNGSRTKRV